MGADPGEPADPDNPGYLDAKARRQRIERRPIERNVSPWPAESPDHAPAAPPYADEPGGAWGANPSAVPPDAGGPTTWGWRKRATPSRPAPTRPYNGWASPSVVRPGDLDPGHQLIDPNRGRLDPYLGPPTTARTPREHGHYQSGRPTPAWFGPAIVLLIAFWVGVLYLVVTGPGLESFAALGVVVFGIVGYFLIVLKGSETADPGARPRRRW